MVDDFPYPKTQDHEDIWVSSVYIPQVLLGNHLPTNLDGEVSELM